MMDIKSEILERIDTFKIQNPYSFQCERSERLKFANDVLMRMVQELKVDESYQTSRRYKEMKKLMEGAMINIVNSPRSDNDPSPKVENTPTEMKSRDRRSITTQIWRRFQ